MKISRVFKVFRRDTISLVRDFMIFVTAVLPIVLAMALNLFIPDVENASIRFVVNSSIDSEVMDEFGKYGVVELAGTREDLYERVEGSDEVAGIDYVDGEYVIVLQGNERTVSRNTAAMILDEYFNPGEILVDVKITDAGVKESPIRRLGTIFILLFSMVAPGLMVGINLVEEKESNTLSALNVTPLTRWELYSGKIAVGLALSMFHVFAVTFVMGYGDVNMFMLFAAFLSSAFIATVLGFLTGAVAENQVAAIALVKLSFTPVMLSFAGAIIVPERWQVFLYWSPFYWDFKVLDGILAKSIEWSQTLYFCGLILLTSAAFYLVFRRKIIKGLQG
ncbi:ABC-2 type transport system permease protein [Dethiosulfatibacter aminovorans DSM 17477]|uniref:ABC-2 type transport system permease protein n=1 Tax=Dethiosulfatibacter aminovorans DSM 17477 TaxID=1121476 RepID=A0A1M6HBB5_9FIRM|nr:ABC transporter permease [Dethiosulfatibacter aminovorans]SHJ19490.1 ABC-2 type transport system permease protein [Dethiosulfatibacter aminovorans DSM 17477]